MLDNVGRNRLLVFAINSDGAKMTNNLHQVVAGLKVVDVGAIETMTDKLIKPQSLNVYWPTSIALGRETELMRTNHINPVHSW